MQTRQIVSQSGVLTVHSGHVGLADDVIAIGNVMGIDFQPIRDVEEALPHTDHRPQFSGRFANSIESLPSPYIT